NGLELVDNQSMVTSITPCFSTLCGSKWIGTPESASARPDTRVSVPSAGRNGLEPAGRRGTGRRAEVSVPSAGRNGLELQNGSLIIEEIVKFQYPLRVEMDWNRRARSARSSRLNVSVPSAGRNGLEPSATSISGH